MMSNSCSGMISLNEAVTLLMGHDRRTPTQEIGRLIKAQNDLNLLALACHRSLKDDAAGRELLIKMSPDFMATVAFPTLPVPAFWPPAQVLEILLVRDASWPAALCIFYDALTRARDEQSAYDGEFAYHLHELLERGRGAQVRYWGALTPGHRAPTAPIPATHFMNRITIDGDRRNLIASDRNRGTRPGYMPTPRTHVSADAMTYYNVEVELADAQRLIAQRSAGMPGTLPHVDPSAVPGQGQSHVATDPLATVTQPLPDVAPLQTLDGTEEGLRVFFQGLGRQPSIEQLMVWGQFYAQRQKSKPQAEWPNSDTDTCKLLKRAGIKQKDLRTIARNIHQEYLPKKRGAPFKNKSAPK